MRVQNRKMKLHYLLTRPITRRATILLCLFTVFFTFYSYQWLTSLEATDFNVEDPELYRTGKGKLHVMERKPWFKAAMEEIIQPRIYKNTNYKIHSTMLLDKQGIKGINKSSIRGVWPDTKYDWDDRIVTQLMHIPEAVKEEQKKPFYKQKLKTIVFWNSGGIVEGRQRLLDDGCPVSQCYLSRNSRLLDKADAVLFTRMMPRGLTKRNGQIWVYFSLESPLHTSTLRHVRGLVNWTATYRRDSVIVAPYEKFVPYTAGVTEKPQQKNYASGKTKMVAWLVSNCAAKSNRGKVAQELSRYVRVDIYGRCGHYTCRKGEAKCFELLDKDYKFYLSFENSNCRDYITEKFYLNGMQHDIIPIVFGATRADYERSVPKHSFIHVDDFKDLRQLASYLKMLDKNDTLYNDYFKWKGTGRFINTFFFCRLCAMLWDQTRDVWYDDLDEWWRGKGICLARKGQSWREMYNHMIITKR
ncbi:glycoprotein 3-alpha-L-fucosyltransferase A-like isoform X2 [Lineus longissimus]